MEEYTFEDVALISTILKKKCRIQRLMKKKRSMHIMVIATHLLLIRTLNQGTLEIRLQERNKSAETGSSTDPGFA